MLSDAVLTTIITAVAGPIIVLYIANRIRNMKPKSERIDTAFEMYDAYIKRQDAEMERKDKIIANLTIEIERLKRRR